MSGVCGRLVVVGGGACHNHGVIWEESPPASVASVVCGQGSHETSFCGIE